jgi:hypothetical protein
LQQSANYVSSEKVSSPVQRDISCVSTPSIQASFISFVVKMGAKEVLSMCEIVYEIIPEFPWQGDQILELEGYY